MTQFTNEQVNQSSPFEDSPKSDTPLQVRSRVLSIRKLSTTTADTDTDRDSTVDTAKLPSTPSKPLKVFGKKSSKKEEKEDKKESLVDLFIFAWFLIGFNITVFIKSVICKIVFFFTGFIWRFYAGIINMVLESLNVVEGFMYGLLCTVVNMSIGRFIPGFIKAWLFAHMAEEDDCEPKEVVKAPKKPLTLVLDLDETLIHSSRDRPEKGDFSKFSIPSSSGKIHEFYLQKRPHLEEFLAGVAKEYNVIIFTAGRMDYANLAINMIENKSFISRRFFRESCYKTEAGWAKDLFKVESDLNKVVLVDNCMAAGSLQPENHILIKSWYNDENDSCLLECKEQLMEFAQRWRTEHPADKDLRQYIRKRSDSFKGEEITRN